MRITVSELELKLGGYSSKEHAALISITKIIVRVVRKL